CRSHQPGSRSRVASSDARGTLALVPDSTPPLADAKYVNLETFKKDGNGVKTPVWAAPLDGKLVVMSAGDAFKVKRLRRDPHARVAACDVRGKVRGDLRE